MRQSGQNEKEQRPWISIDSRVEGLNNERQCIPIDSLMQERKKVPCVLQFFLHCTGSSDNCRCFSSASPAMPNAHAQGDTLSYYARRRRQPRRPRRRHQTAAQHSRLRRRNSPRLASVQAAPEATALGWPSGPGGSGALRRGSHSRDNGAPTFMAEITYLI